MEQDIAAQVVGLGGATDFSLWKLFLFLAPRARMPFTQIPDVVLNVKDGDDVISVDHLSTVEEFRK